MASGLFALLDDIAVLARGTAASLDDIALGASRASVKSIGVIVDDAAVTPQYVQGIHPKRELPIVWRITLGSLRNKFLFIIPVVMILSWLAPWVFPYLLIIGGSYLVYEGAEKVLGWLGLHKHSEKHLEAVGGSAEGERKMVNSAVRTDLVLSTEIMLISLSSLELQDDNWISKLVALTGIAVMMTALVYGAVAVLVKLDDIGLHMARREKRSVRLFGLGLIKAMPKVFSTLSIVGTLAMLWVGGHLLWKSIGDVGVKFVYDSLHTVEDFLHHFHPVIAWFGNTLASAIIGLVIGLVIAAVATVGKRIFRKDKASAAAH